MNKGLLSLILAGSLAYASSNLSAETISYSSGKKANTENVTLEEKTIQELIREPGEFAKRLDMLFDIYIETRKPDYNTEKEFKRYFDSLRIGLRERKNEVALESYVIGLIDKEIVNSSSQRKRDELNFYRGSIKNSNGKEQEKLLLSYLDKNNYGIFARIVNQYKISENMLKKSGIRMK